MLSELTTAELVALNERMVSSGAAGDIEQLDLKAPIERATPRRNVAIQQIRNKVYHDKVKNLKLLG